MRAQLVLPVLAIAASAVPRQGLNFEMLHMDVAPAQFVFAGALAVYLLGVVLHRHIHFVIASSVCVACMGIGPIIRAAELCADAIWNCLSKLLDRFHPRTSSDWGLLCVIASFVLLVVGGVVSLFKRPQEEVPVEG